jgi:hypothetical protein
VIGNIRRDGGTPSVESIATQLSGMHTAQRAPVLLALQQTHGNRYVQRVVALARKGGVEAAPDVEEAIQQARSGGQALDSGVRSQMESAFGADFSGVRVHTSSDADTLNSVLNARAFTTGQDIFFRRGAYNHVSSSGQKLLAHELTHVVQQNGNNIQRRATVGQPGDKYEQEAESVAKQVVGTSTSGSQLPVQQTGLYGEELQKRSQLESDSLIMPRTAREPSTRRSTHVANFTSEQTVQRDFWSSLRRGGEMYYGMDDEGAPFARRLMEWRITGFGRDFVITPADRHWNRFLIERPEIQRAMATKFGSLAEGFAAAGPGSDEFEDSITGVMLNELESMRLTLHGCHRIDISGRYEVIEDGTDYIVRLSSVTFVWVDRADLHPDVETELESGEVVEDVEFTGAGWDYDIRISFRMPRTSTWRVSGGTATHERGWPPVTGAPAAGFRG